MFVFVVPAAVDHLAGVRLVLLHVGPAAQPHVLVYVEVEQRPALALHLVHDEVVERRRVRQDEVLLDVHQPLRWGVAQLPEILGEHVAHLPQKDADAVPLEHLHLAPVSAPVPVAERDLQLLLLHLLLLGDEHNLELLPLVLLPDLPVAVRQEVRLDPRVFAHRAKLAALLFGRRLEVLLLVLLPLLLVLREGQLGPKLLLLLLPLLVLVAQLRRLRRLFPQPRFLLQLFLDVVLLLRELLLGL
mmetsp:Transcript_6042/g.15408  ORF Transcript_6042/g.15408 Transcript_6042/m.15408 type:complete len:244 (-) Transcript_6042:502-1233(-)